MLITVDDVDLYQPLMYLSMQSMLLVCIILMLIKSWKLFQKKKQFLIVRFNLVRVGTGFLRLLLIVIYCIIPDGWCPGRVISYSICNQIILALAWSVQYVCVSTLYTNKYLLHFLKFIILVAIVPASTYFVNTPKLDSLRRCSTVVNVLMQNILLPTDLAVQLIMSSLFAYRIYGHIVNNQSLNNNYAKLWYIVRCNFRFSFLDTFVTAMKIVFNALGTMGLSNYWVLFAFHIIDFLKVFAGFQFVMDTCHVKGDSMTVAEHSETKAAGNTTHQGPRILSSRRASENNEI